MTTERLPFGALILDRSVWPRFRWDPERVDLFKGLFLEGEEPPPIEVVERDDGKYLIADGVHRAIAARSAEKADIEAIVLQPTDGDSLMGFAYRRALETATRAALPLSRDERRAAMQRLLANLPEMSHRAIATLIGVSHDTVDRWARELAESATETCGAPSTPLPDAHDAARRVVSLLAKLDDSRGLLDYLSQARMGRHLGDAFERRFGDRSLDRARVFSKWTSAAVQHLEARNDAHGQSRS